MCSSKHSTLLKIIIKIPYEAIISKVRRIRNGDYREKRIGRKWHQPLPASPASAGRRLTALTQQKQRLGGKEEGDPASGMDASKSNSGPKTVCAPSSPPSHLSTPPLTNSFTHFPHTYSHPFTVYPSVCVPSATNIFAQSWVLRPTTQAAR